MLLAALAAAVSDVDATTPAFTLAVLFTVTALEWPFVCGAPLKIGSGIFAALL